MIDAGRETVNVERPTHVGVGAARRAFDDHLRGCDR
jgi:hypothetical protein